MLTIAGGIIIAVVGLIAGYFVLAVVVSAVQEDPAEVRGCCGIVILLIVLGIASLIFR